MRQKSVISACVLCAVIAVSAMDTLSVSRKGKRIQVDGFLVEWPAGTAFSPNQHLSLDMMHSPDGLAGYLAALDIEGSVSFCIEETGDTVRPGSTHTGDHIFWAAYARDSSDTGFRDVMEWVVPWAALPGNDSLSFSFTMCVLSETGEIMSRVYVQDGESTFPGVTHLFPWRVRIQLAFIVILLAAYIFLRKKARRMRYSQARDVSDPES